MLQLQMRGGREARDGAARGEAAAAVTRWPGGISSRGAGSRLAWSRRLGIGPAASREEAWRGAPGRPMACAQEQPQEVAEWRMERGEATAAGGVRHEARGVGARIERREAHLVRHGEVDLRRRKRGRGARARGGTEGGDAGDEGQHGCVL